MHSRPILASLLCASLASIAPATARAQLPPAGIRAATQVITAVRFEAEEIVTSVLGLRAEDGKAGEDLTVALRKAFAEREMSGGQELSLEEVVLTLDCSSEQDTACMAEAGQALESERMVYGTLAASGGGYVLDIIVLDVASGQVEAQATMPLEKAALASGSIDDTALSVVNSLYPQAEDIPAVPVAAEPGEETQVDEGPEEQPRESSLVWGPYKPRPTWKKVGLGISIGVGVLGAAAAATGWVYAKRHESDVADAVERNMDASPGEELDDYCVRILEQDRKNPDSVTDKPRADKCQSLVGGRTAFRVGLGTAIAGGVSTVVFTVLMFVHRRKAPTADANRRTFHLTANPTEGGAMVGGYGRF